MSKSLGSIRSERVLSLVNWLMVCASRTYNNPYLSRAIHSLQRVDKPSEEQSKSWGASVMELLSDDNGESMFNFSEWP